MADSKSEPETAGGVGWTVVALVKSCSLTGTCKVRCSGNGMDRGDLGMNRLTEPNRTQVARWPDSGRHILAWFDDDSVIVYQA
jgi:hypothetical protein